MSKQSSQSKLVITYTKSAIGYQKRQLGTVHALGLRHIGDVVEHEDTPAIRGMIAKISHLVAVEEQST